MAVAIEDLRTRHTRFVTGREGSRPPTTYDQPLPPHPFLDSLSPLSPLWNDAALPNRLRLPMFKPYILDLSMQGKGQRAPVVEGGDVRRHSSQGVIFLDPQTAGYAEQEVEENDGIEVGRNFYHVPFDRQTYPSPVVQGTPDEIPALADDLRELVRMGRYPVSSKHRHPRRYLPLPSPDDWTAFLYRAYRNDAPVVRELTIVGDGVQVMAIATQQMHPRLDRWEVEELLDEWGDKFERSGSADQIAIQFAEMMRAPLYISTNGEDYDRGSPREIARIVGQMDPYRYRKAA